MSNKDFFTKENKDYIKEKLPEFYKAVTQKECTVIIIHNWAFLHDEYKLLGMAIKYACSKGKDVTVISSKPIRRTRILNK